MATKRTKRTRSRRGVPSELHLVFAIGAGWNHRDQNELAAAWDEYGQAFLESWPHDKPPFAQIVLGPPAQHNAN